MRKRIYIFYIIIIIFYTQLQILYAYIFLKFYICRHIFYTFSLHKIYIFENVLHAGTPILYIFLTSEVEIIRNSIYSISFSLQY